VVKLFKIHKLSGLTAGVILFLLAFTGIFLDHKNFSFLYTITFDSTSSTLLKKESKLFESFWINPKDTNHIIVAGRQGVFEDKGNGYIKILDIQCFSIKNVDNDLYFATEDGVYIYSNKKFTPFALSGKIITSLSIHNKNIVAIVDKKSLYHLDFDAKIIKYREVLNIDKNELLHNIKLSRFVRDVHYGKGLFDGVTSLFLNDFAAFIVMLLSVSGYMIYYLIKRKNNASLSRKLIKFHANVWVLFSIIPLVLLSLSGILLDHSSFFKDFMKKTELPHTILPPVYNSLSEDIYSLDYFEGEYKIGNRYGVYSSKDLEHWKFVSAGFAYRMLREDGILHVSGMGAPNRILIDDTFIIEPNTPHMYKDFTILNNKKKFLSHRSDIALPKFTSITLYTLLLSLHDGMFFSPHWIWVNDIAATLLLVLLFTGTIRYFRRKKFFK